VRLQPGEKGRGISTVVSWKEELMNAKIALQSAGVLRLEEQAKMSIDTAN
jgi:hypothetical protein